MFRWCKISCKLMGYVLAGVGLAIILLTFLPVWLIVGILGLVLIFFGLSMIF